MLFANAKTQNPDLAAEYLAMQVSEDYIYSFKRIVKTFLGKDTMSYFTYKPGSVESEYELIKEPFQLDIYSSLTVKNGDKIFKNSAPRLYICDLDESQFFNDIYWALVDGNMTVDQAAEKIFTEVKIRVME